MSLTSDPYAAGKVTTNLYAKKRDVSGPLVVVLDGMLEDRNLSLIAPSVPLPVPRPGSRADTD